MPGIGVINNPRSRQNLKHPQRIKKLGYILGQDGESKETWNFEALDEVLKDFKKRDIDIIAINGGDGSNHVTLTSLIKIWGEKPLPKVALLRGGTLNTISNACKIKGSTTWLLYNLSDKYSMGEPFEIIQRNLMKIGDRYGFIFGNGVVAKFMKTYYDTGTPSPSHGAKVFLRGIYSVFTGGKLAKEWFRKLNAKVTIDDIELPKQPLTTMLAASIHEVGLGFIPFSRCEETPERFHVSLYAASPAVFLLDVPYMYFGRANHPRTGYEFAAKKVVIEIDEPWSYCIDGDMHTCESGKMTIEKGPRLNIIRK